MRKAQAGSENVFKVVGVRLRQGTPLLAGLTPGRDALLKFRSYALTTEGDLRQA